MLRHVVWVCCLLAVTWGTAQSLATDAALRREHDALFATFLPLDAGESDATTAAMLGLVRDELWTAAKDSASLRAMWLRFADLRSLSGACGLPESIVAAHWDFASVPISERADIFARLQACSVPEIRLTSNSLRNFYVAKGYGAVQEEITGIHLDTVAPSAYIQSHTPKLPRTRLTY